MPVRLSVIIPNYNYGDYIRAAIDSALALDWPDVEVIVVDDGSTDHSRNVIETYGERITAIFQPNASQRVACNVGYSHATGDAVLFLDSDDLVDPSLMKEVAAVWTPSVSKVQVQMMRVDAQGRPLNSVFPAYKPTPTPEKIFDWIVRTTAYPTPPGSGNVYARTFLNRLFPLDNFCGDASDSACLAAAPFLGEVVTIIKPLVFYRLHGSNDSKLSLDQARFARELRRARARYIYSQKFAGPDRPMDDSALFNSLEVLQLRIASLRLCSAEHPLHGDSWMRALGDCLRVPLTFPAATVKARVIVGCWALMTLLAPGSIAGRLIGLRYR